MVRTVHAVFLVAEDVCNLGADLECSDVGLAHGLGHGLALWLLAVDLADSQGDLVGGTGDGAYGPCGVSGRGRCVWERILHVATLVLRSLGTGLPLGFAVDGGGRSCWWHG